MRLLCHRGIWTNPEERNSWLALIRALDLGHGVETDVRDCDGQLVISHDPPLRSCDVSLDRFLAYYANCKHRPCLALNIKSDGLQRSLSEALERYDVENYFVFDMSVPDTLAYAGRGMDFAARVSEYEPSNTLSASSKWIWLDAFHGEWYSVDTVRFWLNQGKHVAIVSPELHRRAHEARWAELRDVQEEERLYLCTDFVQDATEYFNVKKD